MKKKWYLSIPLQLAVCALISTLIIVTIANSTQAYLNYSPAILLKGGTSKEDISQFVTISTQFLLLGSDVYKTVEFWIIALVPAVSVYVISQKLLHPLRDMVEISGEINAGSLAVRFPEDVRVAEFSKLSETANQMLSQLEGAFRQQKLAYEQQGRFVADAAHELRTPLATLRSNLEVFQDDPTATSEDYQNLIRTQERVLQRLEKLVTNLLILAQQGTVNREEVYLALLLEEVIENLTPLAKESQVSLQLSGDANTAALGAEDLLAMVFHNLIENGIRYNHPGGKVEITLSEEADQAVITVVDTGIGISQENQKYIFERFFRAEKSRQYHDSGAGLGLCIAAHILKRHNGTILVESEHGKGATFTVTIPKT